jgi:hypothetical protein
MDESRSPLRRAFLTVKILCIFGVEIAYLALRYFLQLGGLLLFTLTMGGVLIFFLFLTVCEGLAELLMAVLLKRSGVRTHSAILSLSSRIASHRMKRHALITQFLSAGEETPPEIANALLIILATIAGIFILWSINFGSVSGIG